MEPVIKPEAQKIIEKHIHKFESELTDSLFQLVEGILTCPELLAAQGLVEDEPCKLTIELLSQRAELLEALEYLKNNVDIVRKCLREKHGQNTYLLLETDHAEKTILKFATLPQPPLTQ